MVLTPSNMVPLGMKAPDFNLPDVVSGENKTLANFKSDIATVVMFICNHCPYVKHIQPGLVSLADDYIARGVSFVALNSNDVENYPDDSPDKMLEDAKRLNYPFSYLFDENQEIARAYDAACTPDFFVFDRDFSCVYRGQMDNSRPENGKPVTGADLRAALDAVIAGEALSESQIPSMGCNIKWKK
ncbi:MAG: redoxin domain-containing protein [Candidatus Mycalebacterium zealandia]|nr:MAG: redoxin domain-containing protein [Candidatus Mycalebacterium zealandia]